MKEEHCGGAPPSQRARLGQAYGGGRGGAGAPPSQPARQRPQSQRIRAAATAALRLTRGGRARDNESTVNIYGSYGMAYGVLTTLPHGGKLVGKLRPIRSHAGRKVSAAKT